MITKINDWIRFLMIKRLILKIVFAVFLMLVLVACSVEPDFSNRCLAPDTSRIISCLETEKTVYGTVTDELLRFYYKVESSGYVTMTILEDDEANALAGYEKKLVAVGKYSLPSLSDDFVLISVNDGKQSKLKIDFYPNLEATSPTETRTVTVVYK